MSAFNAQSFLAQMTEQMGAYVMYDAAGTVIYVGKANRLKSRLSHYFQKNVNLKTKQLVSKIANIQVTIVRSEKEALLLERELIRAHQPRYNILLRDDKSYPYILVSDDAYPRMVSYRQSRKKPSGTCYGPYTGTEAVRVFLELGQKLFKIRNCTNSFFANRSRPCLQYQIGRCSAPCVGYITPEAYAQSVEAARAFLSGQDRELIASYVVRMERSAADQDYEKAAEYRDVLQSLAALSDSQSIVQLQGSADILACTLAQGASVIHLLKVREGAICGSESYQPSNPLNLSAEAVLEHFILSHYCETIRSSIPKRLYVNVLPESAEVGSLLAEKAKRQVKVLVPKRGAPLQWMQTACQSAEVALKAQLNSQRSHFVRFEAFVQAIGLKEPPERVACFDISHTFGEETMASCVVFTKEGPDKKAWRHYRLEMKQGGDDYEAMRQALSRYARAKDKAQVCLIDGGKGQMSQARQVFEENDYHPEIIGVAKGPARKAGREKLFRYVDGNFLQLEIEGHDKAHHFVQQVRDEAHRFAIQSHRRRRDKKRSSSSLESIPGVGKKRAQQLLAHFGGLAQLQVASPEAIAAIKGISVKTAQQIYDALHKA